MTPDSERATAPAGAAEAGQVVVGRHNQRTHNDPVKVAPIDGGGPCDRCGARSFRRLSTGLGWRHEPCDPPALRQLRKVRLFPRTAR